MPNYEYACKECKEVWEEMRKVADCLVPTNKKCPHCNAKKGSVYRHFSSAPSMKMDANMDLSKPHNRGGFQDAMRRIADSPGVKGTKYADKLKEKHIS
tara:strand:- start:68 stop:361 length:294 start_codon:yes stop_codon:yes gene_type:complete